MPDFIETRRLAACAALSGVILLSGRARTSAESPRTFLLDPASSQVRIELGRAGLLGILGHDHSIAAPLAEGWIETAGSTLEQSRLFLRFQSSGLSIVPGSEPAKDIPEVEQRMRGPEVLDVERYPTIAFTAAVVSGRAEGRGAYQIRVRGSLELRGRQHDIDLPVAVRIDGDVLTAKGEVQLRLADLGVTPPSVAGVVKVDNRFNVTFDVKARLAPAGHVVRLEGRQAVGARMPSGASPLDSIDLANIRDWIDQGARNN